MTAKMTQKNYEAIKIYNQKERIFELRGRIQTLENQLKIAMNGLFEICNNPSPDFNRILYAREIWHKVKELEK